jgi:hypothetical protein
LQARSVIRDSAVPAPGSDPARGDRAAQELASPGENIPRFRFNPSTRRIIMQDNKNERPPIEGELTDEDLKQVAGAGIPVLTNGSNQNNQGDDNSQGNEDQGNPPIRRKW